MFEFSYFKLYISLALTLSCLFLQIHDIKEETRELEVEQWQRIDEDLYDISNVKKFGDQSWSFLK